VLRVRVAADAVREHERIVLIVAMMGVMLGGLIGWIAIVSSLDPRAMDDRGLISILPVSAYLVLGLNAAAFVLTLRMRPLPVPLVTLEILTMILMMYGAPGFIEEMPRFVTAWLHVGFVDAIDSTGRLHPLRDARFDWPAFFVLAAFVRSVAGFDSSVGFLTWVPPVQVALYVGPLYLIYRSASPDPRLAWLAIWTFVLTNWVGQDYFSPQGLNVLFMLVIFGILLAAFRRGPSDIPVRLAQFVAWVRRRLRVPLPLEFEVDPRGHASKDLSFRMRVGLVAAVVLLFGTSVASHQLTPFAVVGGVIGLAVFRRLTLPGYVPIMIVLLVSWLMFMATTFLAGHLAGLLEEVGQTDQLASTAVADRLGGSLGHLFVVQGRVVFTLAVWLLALIGGVRRLASGRIDLSLAILAIAPFGLMLFQSYGGEILLRVFLFALPFMAFFAAAAFLPRSRPASWGLSIVLLVTSLALAGGMILSRYGNEKADMVTAAEYEGLVQLAAVAAPGDRIVSINHNVPADYFEWVEHRYVSVPNEFAYGDAHDVIDQIAANTPLGNDAFLVLTRGQRAYAELFWNMSDEEWNDRAEAVAQRMDLVYRNNDITVLRWSRRAAPS
jgi:hypothetical protein